MPLNMKYAVDTICIQLHNQCVWDVLFHDEFDPEFDRLPEAVQDELFAHAAMLAQFGPRLGRPRVDTLNGSRHANMKELRFDAAGGGCACGGAAAGPCRGAACPG